MSLEVALALVGVKKPAKTANAAATPIDLAAEDRQNFSRLVMDTYVFLSQSVSGQTTDVTCLQGTSCGKIAHFPHRTTTLPYPIPDLLVTNRFQVCEGRPSNLGFQDPKVDQKSTPDRHTPTMHSPTLRGRGLGFLLIPVLLLPVVALTQARLHADSALSSWRGGGFGMFATVDRDYYRSFQISAQSSDGSILKIDWPQIEGTLSKEINFQELATDARALPTSDRLAALADLLATRTWQRNGDRADLLLQGNGIKFRPRDFVIQVYGITYNKTLNSVTPQLLTTWTGASQ